MIFTKQIKETKPYDLVVCGGGPSGCAAALAAAQDGLAVLLVEGRAKLGGTATSGLVSHWLGGRTQGGAWVVGGLFRSLAEAAAARGVAVIPHLSNDTTYQPYGWLPWFIHGIPLDPHGVARLLDERMKQEKVEVLLDTQVVDPVVVKNRITHVVIYNKSGHLAVPAAAFVDATGDADIAARSGCAYRKGRAEDGLMTPATLGFHLYNVDHAALSEAINRDHTPKFRAKIKQLRAAGVWQFPYDIFISVQLVDDSTALINTSRLVGIDGTDGQSVTEAYMRGRQETEELLKILREHFPGFKNARIKEVASMLGIRETRRIDGVYELTLADLRNDSVFDDTIGFSTYGWDLPDPRNPSVQPLVDEAGGRFENKAEKALSTPIPYRIMLPQPIKNLICTGRCVSVERDVLGPLRVMAPSMAMGEAAGRAAAIALRARSSFVEVPASELCARLRAKGCIVDREALPKIEPRRDP
jgi:hypothetical protein